MTAHKPAPAQAHAAPAPQTTAPTPAEPAASTQKAVEATATPKSSLLYSVVLTGVAVLPIAFGLGAVRLKASIRKPVIAPVVSPHAWNPNDLDPKLRTANRELGDRKFLERRFEVALNYYRALGSSEPEQMAPELLYRVGLCEEELGLWNEAMESFRSVTSTTDNLVLKAAATFAQARTSLRLKEPEQAVALLRPLTMPISSESRLPKAMSQEIDFLFPLALAEEAIQQWTQDEGVPSVPLAKLINWPLETALRWGDETLLLDTLTPDATLPDNALTCTVKRPVIRGEVQSRPETWSADVCASNQTVQSVVECVAKECGWSVDWSGLPADRQTARLANLSLEKRPVYWLLTVLCSELKANWSLDQGKVVITRSGRHNEQSRAMIIQTLSSLPEWIPEHRLANHAKFEQGQFAQMGGQLKKAAAIYASLIGKETTSLAIHAAYNSGEIDFRLADYSAGCQQLRFIVDGAPEHELHTDALIMMGRMLLDMGDSQEAIYQFRRATEARGRTNEQARAAVLMGLSFLVQSRYSEAADAVFLHRMLLEEASVRRAAAFVTAYARWNTVNADLRPNEGAFLYRSLIALRSDVEWLGQTGHLLIGRAYADLGFDDQMSDIYLRSLANGTTKSIEIEMRYWLADYEYSNGATESARQILEQLADGQRSGWRNRARWKLAEIALLEGQPKECLNHCEQVETGEVIPKADVQKLMGRAFEKMGDDVRAAKCYAGQLPSEE